VYCTELSFSWLRQLEDKKTNRLSDTVTFECELSLEVDAVEWYRGDRALKTSDKHQIAVKGTVHRLTINDVDSKDAGQYSAVFKNKPTTANLTVEGCSLCHIQISTAGCMFVQTAVHGINLCVCPPVRPSVITLFTFI